MNGIMRNNPVALGTLAFFLLGLGLFLFGGLSEVEGSLCYECETLTFAGTTTVRCHFPGEGKDKCRIITDYFPDGSSLTRCDLTGEDCSSGPGRELD